MRHLLTLMFVVFLIQSLYTQGTIVRRGAEYDPGTRVSFPTVGVSFLVPRDWKGALEPQDPIFVMASDVKAGIGLAILQSGTDRPAIQKYLSTTQNLGDNIVLHPAGNIEPGSSQLSMNYTSNLYRGRASAIAGPHGNSIVFFFAGPAVEEKYYRTVLDKLVSFTSFYKPDPTLVTGEWQKSLAGITLKISREDSAEIASGGISHIELCRDGKFIMASGEETRSGQWSIEARPKEIVLILTESDSSTSRITLSTDGRSIFLNGRRFEKQKSANCLE